MHVALISVQYSFDGYLFQVLRSQSFEVPGSAGFKVSGEYILESVYGVRNVRPFQTLVVLFGWVALLRIVHIILFVSRSRGTSPQSKGVILIR